MTNSFSAHTSTIQHILPIADLNLTVSVADFDSVKVWSSLTWSLQRTIPNVYISSIAYMSNGIVALGSREWRIHFCNVINGVLSSTITVPTTPTSLKSLETNNGRSIAAGLHSGWIYIYDYTNGGVFYRSFQHCSDEIHALELVNSTLLASGCNDGSIKVWAWQEGVSLFNLVGHFSDVNVLKSLTSSVLASGSSDSTIKLWDISQVGGGSLLQTLLGHTNSIWGLDLLENCVLISGSLDQSLKLWDLNQNNGLLLSSTNTSMGIRTLTVSPQAICSKLKLIFDSLKLVSI
jgi:WD40 repeat protein